MKFGKSLSNQIEETLPEWRDKFLSYKELKKRLKLIGGDDRPAKKRRVAEAARECAGGEDMTEEEEEADFVRLLEDELEKASKVVRELQDRVAKAKDSSEEMTDIRKEIVDFHGEMVLLENYSALNYTGLVKILKKYDKRTGALLRLPFIQKVLQQPFFITDLLYKLVKECETMLDRLFPAVKLPTEAAEGDAPSTSATSKEDRPAQSAKELAEIEYVKSLYMKSTISALRVLKEIRSGSSTVSVFSLPPLQISGVDDTWSKIPVLEQAAK
ncbi:hypothetical protein RJ640_018134 [Escallonia rubra]|uniref:SPX domain-containing protein n=1 Tax=Escallonia rubra TaxID=112253 RepID=A0AA88R7H9_9ASTE|nr:hypothetical protein RJ640_018134 [Escallonia rubra]